MSSPAGTSSRPTRCARSTGSRTPTTPTLLEDGSWCARQPQRAPPQLPPVPAATGGGPQRRRAGGAPVTSHGPDDSIPSLAAKPLTSQATSGSWERGATSLCHEHRRSRGRRSGRARRSRSCRPARWGGSTGRTRAPYMCTRPPLVAPHTSPSLRPRRFHFPVASTRANVDGRRLPAATNKEGPSP